MATIYLEATDRNDGNMQVTSHHLTGCVGLRVTRYHSDGVGFGFDLTMSVARARELARELELAADAIANATELPANARVVDDSAGFVPCDA